MNNIYFRNNFVSIYFDKDFRIGKAVWRGDLIGSEFREAVLLCLDLIDRHSLVGWLGDNRKMKSIRPDDLEWSLKHFLPQLLDSSLVRLANIPSQDSGNRAAVEEMYNKKGNAGKLLVQDFALEEEAMAWLRETS
ncbi:hypothetical protein GCM10023188_35280 [Pontibacter saemangeumensis]|uniref:SpoIIAA-like n=1 Tax=Pontibacter saemangeumensis TaxID=1084525 RepID=A0ABP8LY73_9BACT